jgi:type III pantothenate kinase
MKLLIDVGNSRIKWAAHDGRALGPDGSAVHTGDLRSVLYEFESGLPEHIDRVLVANVAGPLFADELVRFIEQKYSVTPEFVASAPELGGIRSAYREPSRLGVDRWVAMIAAFRIAAAVGPPSPCCVIDAGTAATLDAIDGDGVHLGGLIFAGPRLVASVLRGGTKGIGMTSPAPRPPRGFDLLGADTDSAVGNAAWLALAAGIDRAIESLAQGLAASPRVFLTGGDGPALAPWLKTTVEYRASLVLEGLAMISEN